MEGGQGRERHSRIKFERFEDPVDLSILEVALVPASTRRDRALYLGILLGFFLKHIKSIGLIISHGGLAVCILPMTRNVSVKWMTDFQVRVSGQEAAGLENKELRLCCGSQELISSTR